MRFFRNLAGILLTSAANAPIALLSSIVLARWLSPDDRGLYAICAAFAATLTILVQLGWPSASIYRLRSVKSSPAVVATTALLVGFAISAVTLASSVALEPALTRQFLDGAPSIVFYLILATVPLRLFGNLFGSVARGIDRFRYENWYSFSLTTMSLVAFAIVLVIGGGGLVDVLWALVVVYAVATLGLVVTVVRETGLTRRFEGAQVSASLRFGLKTYLQTLVARVHEQQDVFLLAYLLGDPRQVAYFAVAKGAARMLELVPLALNKAAFPQLAELSAVEASTFAGATCRQGVLFVVPVSLAVGTLASFLLPAVYGPEYARSVVPFLLLLPCVTFLTIDGVVGRFFNATNHHAPVVAIRSASALVNLGLNLWWIPKYGIEGAAAAALASFGLQAALAVGVFRARTGTGVRDLLLPQRADLDPYTSRLTRLAGRLGR